MSATRRGPSRVRLEHLEPGRLGIGHRTPRVTWMDTDATSAEQDLTAEIEVTRRPFNGATTTEVFTVERGPDQFAQWPAAPLTSMEAVAVRARTQCNSEWSEWSESVSAETGLDTGDWEASFVGPDPEPASGARRRPARVRKAFTLPAAAVRARLHLSGHGLVEAELNGERVGDEELTPGWTSYQHRLRTATFDVTAMLHQGENVVGVWLADGWWRGRIGFAGGTEDIYGSDLAALVQIEVLDVDGVRHRVVSDASWSTAPSPTLHAGLYDGEHTDLRLADPDWSTPPGASERWQPVTAARLDTSVLVAPDGPPVRCTQELVPVSIEERPGGSYIVDFGQNHSGRVRLQLDAPAGTEIVLRHAEVLEHGELSTRPLRQAEATDRVIAAGRQESWEPRATIHGYRYVEVTGWPGPLTPDSIVSRVIHTDLEQVGWFDSSDSRLNRLHENVRWSLRSNFVDIPTDCPQRDERLGWTGDVQVFAPTAAFLYDVTGMLASWLQDVAIEQEALGSVPLVVPNVPAPGFEGLPPMVAALWGDVAVLTPDDLHRSTGDRSILRQQWDSAAAWVDTLERAAGPSRLVPDAFQLGDWLDPTAPADDPSRSATPAGLVATAYLAHSSGRLASIARAIGEDPSPYEQLSSEVRAAYRAAYLDENGNQIHETQTALALSTVFDLWPDDSARARGGEALADLVRSAGGQISTGFAGTPVVTAALSATGHVEEAYRLLLADECPSWLWTVAMGATTIWERWDSLLPDGIVNPGEMTSFNHYALGSVAAWMHETVAGLSADRPGYRRLRIAPRPGGGLLHASARHLTPFGEAAVAWRIVDDNLVVTATVPPGTTAVVDLPEHPEHTISAGEHVLTVPLPSPRPMLDRTS